ncbi:MAG: hypothetical protein WKF83_14425 [Nocardioidaceae bacterium]
MSASQCFQHRRIGWYVDLWLVDHDAAGHTRPEAQHHFGADGQLGPTPGVLDETSAVGAQDDVCPRPPNIDPVADELRHLADRGRGDQMDTAVIVVRDRCLRTQRQRLAQRLAEGFGRRRAVDPVGVAVWAVQQRPVVAGRCAHGGPPVHEARHLAEAAAGLAAGDPAVRGVHAPVPVVDQPAVIECRGRQGLTSRRLHREAGKQGDDTDDRVADRRRNRLPCG